ncbi:MAG TPA: glycosyltransferase family 2 protein [Candidatus Binatia bacterium]
MAVSVIVSNFNGARWLPRLLDSIAGQRNVALETIIVDRHSTDHSLHIIAQHPGVRVVHEPPESGLAAGYRAGAATACHDHLFFCNEDMWFDADCLTRLEAKIDLSRRIACADPAQWSYDGEHLIHTGAQIERAWNRGSPHPWRPFRENPLLPDGAIIAAACAGAMMVHRAAYDDAGGWDTSFFLDHEDTDLAIRLWQRGWATVTVPQAKVFHRVGATNDKTIPRLNVPVARKRYIGALSNQIVIVWKFFSPRGWFLPLLPWLEIFLKDLLQLRLRRALWDVLGLKLSIARLPAIARFRRLQRRMISERPGELYYTDPQFQFGASVMPAPAINPATIRLSIALATRNRPAWLRRCLASWRAQVAQPFEIVISDDSDNRLRAENRRIAEEFGCAWVAGPRRGLYANRNNAFRAASGTHVMSADDDHTHPKDFLVEILARVAADSEAIWTVSERPAERPDVSLAVPGELRGDGTIGPAENSERSAAIACGSTVYPRKVFDLGLRCPEYYRFGGLWYLWGHQLRRAGFRIRHIGSTFVWHHATSSLDRHEDWSWIEAQHECNLYVQATHAFWVSRRWTALCRTLCQAVKLLIAGEAIAGQRPVRVRARHVVRAFTRALRTSSL